MDSDAIKLFIVDVEKSSETSSGVYEVKVSSQDLRGQNSSTSVKLTKTLPLKVVWIQGDVVDTRIDSLDGSKLLVVQDATGEAMIAGWSSIPGGDHNALEKGCYVGVLGQVLATKPKVFLRAVKIMVLNKNRDLLKSMWPLEVDDLKAFVLGCYSSWNN